MIEIGTCRAEAGEKKNGWLAVEGGGVNLPITVLAGAQEGPAVLLSAGVHGAEYIGIQALMELSRELAPEQVKGSLLFLLIANPTAAKCFQRFTVPEDGKNLNRVFPGRAEGTLSERIAWTITEQLQSRADYYIDVHAGDTSEEVMPFVYYNTAAGPEIARISEEMASAADMAVRARSEATNGAYSSACQRRLPAILMERGGGGRFTRREVELYKQDLRNVLIHLGVLEGKEIHTVSQKRITQAVYLEAPQEGFWYPAFRAGDRFEKDAGLGTLRDVWGNVLATFSAEYDGIVLYQTVGMGVQAGDPLVAYGRWE